jgi:sterol 3beta-glucosyltransferase
VQYDGVLQGGQSVPDESASMVNWKAVRLAAVSFGSRGDIEPFVTLGGALVRAGHQVRLLTHPEYAPLLEGSGVELASARGRSARELMDSDEGRELLNRIGNPLTALRRLADLLAPELRLIYADTLGVVAGADAVLAFPATFPALDVAAHLRLPVVHVHHVPAVPTRRHPAPVAYIGARSLTPAGNRASYEVDAWLLWRLTDAAAQRARSQVLGSGRPSVRRVLAQRRRRAGAVVGVSTHVLPRPRDWPGDVVTCGYWWGRNGRAPLDPATEAFLGAGSPPVFFGLGSTPLADAGATTRDVVAAARDSGVRLVLQRGWAGLGSDVEGTHVHVVGDVSYDALFPRVAAVAHHGGAGTTALGLLHGRPTLCLPAVADQFFWGHRVAALGAGPAPLTVKRLRRDSLARRLSQLVRDVSYRQRACMLAAALAREDGRGAAVTAVEEFLSV